MSTIRVTGGVADLERKMRSLPPKARKDMRRVVVENVRAGRVLTRDSARRTARSHGKHYPKAITSEMTGPLIGEWGPDASKPQGGMSFEGGSRNQPAHLNMAKNADIVARMYHQDVADLPRRWQL